MGKLHKNYTQIGEGRLEGKYVLDGNGNYRLAVPHLTIGDDSLALP
jgi:hypothetical protein